MLKISTHICEEIKDSGVRIKKLEADERQEILSLVMAKYVDSEEKYNFLWDHFTHYEALHDGMAWSYIKDFVKENACIIFFCQADDKNMFLIRSGDDLHYILSETYQFEFYITDQQCSYLLCFSDHDILYGCGDAKEWVRGLREQI